MGQGGVNGTIMTSEEVGAGCSLRVIPTSYPKYPQKTKGIPTDAGYAFLVSSSIWWISLEVYWGSAYG